MVMHGKTVVQILSRAGYCQRLPCRSPERKERAGRVPPGPRPKLVRCSLPPLVQDLIQAGLCLPSWTHTQAGGTRSRRRMRRRRVNEEQLQPDLAQGAAPASDSRDASQRVAANRGTACNIIITTGDGKQLERRLQGARRRLRL